MSRDDISEMSPNSTQASFEVLGVRLHPMNLHTAVAQIDAAILANKKGYICPVDVNTIMHARQDPAFCQMMNTAILNTTDGMPLVWLARQAGWRDAKRVYGPDLMLQMFMRPPAQQWRHFFYGGADGVAEILKHRFEAQFPSAKIVGIYTPPFRPLNADEEAALRQQIEQCKPDIMWIGLGTPKQQRFMAEYLPKLDVKIMLGVGAAFDFHSGRVRQAPRWMQQCGLEWLFRLCMEPRRLARRYLINIPHFSYLMIANGWRSGFKRPTRLK